MEEMLILMNTQDVDSLEIAARLAAQVKPVAFAGYVSKSFTGIKLFGDDGRIVGSARTDQWIDEIKVSPDGTMALALWRQESSKTGLTTGRLVVSSKDGVLAKTEIRDTKFISKVCWCGQDILLKTDSGILKWNCNRASRKWSLTPFAQCDGSILSEGRRFWKCQGNQLIESIEDIPLNSITVGAGQTACLTKIENSPFLLRGVVPDEGEKVTRVVYYLDNLQSGKETLLVDGAFGDSAMLMPNTKSLLYYKWTSLLRGQLVMREFPYGQETLIGPETRIPAAIKLGDDAVLIGEQGFTRDSLYIFRPSTKEKKPVDIRMIAAIHIGSTR